MIKKYNIICKKDLSQKTEYLIKIKSLFFILIPINILLLIGIITFDTKTVYCPDVELTYEISHTIIKDSIDPFEIKKYIKERNIKFGNIVYAQCILESNMFNSELTKKANNFIGMKIACRRPTTNDGQWKGYAIYRDWRACLNDYILWQNNSISNWQKNNLNKQITENDYFNILKNTYAEDSLYTQKLKNIINTLNW